MVEQLIRELGKGWVKESSIQGIVWAFGRGGR